ncbi:hypothetical protein GS597_01475 [Synechococcales cyanobacterium C]|uniref:Uncharacterized protein n=1 Tax=Petrachloros mirabilis ULC683 TaxID=2781853 RepID=A0A8K2A6J0_9CYAN|nr:hypothetical protein [Petrachloros mirabilis]NCJ05210.1 hypothetical protein [Petrachloros mirabilis ULC683]
MPWIFTDSAQLGALEQRYRAAAAPTDFTLLLCSGGNISAASTLTEIEAAEISGNGYARKMVTFPAGSFDTIQNRAELRAEVTQTATGGPITWDAIVLLRNTASAVEAVFQETTLQSIADGVTRRIAIDFNLANEGIDVSTSD